MRWNTTINNSGIKSETLKHLRSMIFDRSEAENIEGHLYTTKTLYFKSKKYLKT
jgi:hypothetical protein